MICKKCGSEDFEQAMMTVPYAWGPSIGVINVPGYYWRCKKCDTPHMGGKANEN